MVKKGKLKLSKRKGDMMYSWQAIQETIEYIEKNYDQEIDIDKLASIAHLSKYYFQRLFFRLTNKTVGEYVKLRRLEKAAKLLKESDDRIIDIAIACGFSGHSAFTRAFKEVYQITPDEYRRQEICLDHFIKPDLSLNYIMIEKNVPLIVEGMVLEISEKKLDKDIIFVGRSKLASIEKLGESKVNQLVSLWQEFESSKDMTVDILTLSENPDMFNYFVGIEKNQNVDGYEMRVMPKGDYVVCSYEAENFELLVSDAIYRASKYLYEVYLPNHNLQPDNILIQKYFNPYQENCYIELWAKLCK